MLTGQTEVTCVWVLFAAEMRLHMFLHNSVLVFEELMQTGYLFLFILEML